MINCFDNNGNEGFSVLGEGKSKWRYPEEKPVAERWSTWVSFTLPSDHIAVSVDEDGVCAVTVEGVDEMLRSNVNYTYTARAGEKYSYIFEAWTAPGSGNRTLDIQYFGGTTGGPYLVDITPANPIVINEDRKTYIITGNTPLPRDVVASLEFRSAILSGVFYLKVLSISRWGAWADNKLSPDHIAILIDNDDVCAVTIGGAADDIWDSNAFYAYTVKSGKKYTYTFEAWTAPGSGNRTLDIQYFGGNVGGPYLTDITPDNPIIIDETRKTYSITGNTPIPLPEGEDIVTHLEFRSATEPGVFCLKVLSITETE